MRLFGALLVAAFGAVAASSAKAAPAPASTECRAGRPEPQDPISRGQLRPTPTALCPYDLRHLYGRIARLIASKRGSLRVEYIESLFGIPPMTTSYDDARMADYTTHLMGAGGWTLSLWVREGFYPLDRRRAMFRPGLRPRRLAPINRATVLVDLSLLQPNHPTPAATRCMTAANALARAGIAGWHEERLIVPPTDGGPQMPVRARGDNEILSITMPVKDGYATEAELEGSCLTDLLLSQDPKAHR
jgi:hypothetical protein